MDNKPTELEFQRVGLLAVLSQFAQNKKVDPVTRLSLKQATMKIINAHPIGDRPEEITKHIMR